MCSPTERIGKSHTHNTLKKEHNMIKLVLTLALLALLTLMGADAGKAASSLSFGVAICWMVTHKKED